jgi:hypothetical protein
MLRFTIRDVLWLVVVMAMVAAVFFTRSARDSDLRQATRRASDQEIEAANARYEAAKGAFDMELGRWFHGGSGIFSVRDACEAIERFAYATEEMRNDPELRVKQLARALEAAQQVLSSEIVNDKSGAGSPMVLYRAKYTRADMEARLRRAEQELAAEREQK